MAKGTGMLRRVLAALLLAMLMIACAAVAMGQVEINQKISVNEGDVTVSWTDSASNGPYIVAYEYTDGSGVKQMSYYAGGNKAQSTTYSKSFTISGLIPGARYIIKVYDGSNNRATRTITVPEASSFVDGRLQAKSLKTTIDYRYLENRSSDASKAKNLKTFSHSAMYSHITNDGFRYGIRYKITIPQLAKTREYRALLAFYAPNGFVDTAVANVRFRDFGNASSSYLEWYCIGDFFFEGLCDNFGMIPVGTYRVELYLDGMFVNSKSFKVE